MDKYRIDSHKLIYHIPRLNDWLRGKTVYPIYMEVSPTGACNHRCTYCGLDFMQYKPRYLDTRLLKQRLSELGGLGLKSIMYAGEGEPFMHRDMVELVKHTKSAGIDVALTTNGILFKEDVIDAILGDAEWIKVGLDGATKDTYAKIHRCKSDDFDSVVRNLSYAVKIKRQNNYNCTLGIQFLLLPENTHEAVALAKMASDIGVDYLVVKPYSQHPQSKTTIYSSVKYSDYEHLAGKLETFNSDKFSVIFRIHTMRKWDDGSKNYRKCMALPFWSYIDSGGNVWGCSVYLGDERFLYGNIYDNSFKEIWEGVKRLQSLRLVEEEIDVADCRTNCRMDEINRYLWELKNPPEHVNFI